MQPLSSVMAFLARFLREPAASPEVQAILDALAPAERRLLTLLAGEPDAAARLRCVSAETGSPWTPARLLRHEQLALTHLRRLLQAQGVLLP